MVGATNLVGPRPGRLRSSLPVLRAALLALLCACVLQAPDALAEEEPCTLAIVAADPVSNQVGYGVLSSAPAGTAEIGWTRTGVGAVAVLGSERASLALRGLDFLSQGVTVVQAAQALAQEAAHANRLQVALVSADASTAARSGADARAWKGHLQGTTYACLASGARGESVILQVGVAFETAQGDLADRLLAGLLAGQNAQADHRPIRSAALRVTASKLAADARPPDPSGAVPAAFVPSSIDLRVDDHEDPVREVGRLLGVLDSTSLHRLGSRPIVQTRGEDIYQVQLMLSDLGLYEEGADGVLNDATIDAIRAFRRQAGLEDLPVLDATALQSLLSLHRAWKLNPQETLEPRTSAAPVEAEILPESLRRPAPSNRAREEKETPSASSDPD